jgi:hypothetical protein
MTQRLLLLLLLFAANYQQIPSPIVPPAARRPVLKSREPDDGYHVNTAIFHRRFGISEVRGIRLGYASKWWP